MSKITKESKKKIGELELYLALLIISIIAPYLFTYIGYLLNGETSLNKGYGTFLIISLFSLYKIVSLINKKGK